MDGRTRRAPRWAAAAVALVSTVALTACTGQTEAGPTPTGPTTVTPGETSTPDPTGPVAPTGEYTDIATGLDVPWSIVPLDDERVLLSFRDTGEIVIAARDGSVTPVVTVEGVVPAGEGGLLGLALLRPDADEDSGTDSSDETVTGPASPLDGSWLYAYFTAASDNRVVRYRVEGSTESPSFGEREIVIDGIPKAGNHKGGRIAFGPDGMLYVTTGDAGDGSAAQDASSIAGKILRLQPDGSVPADNPTTGSPVYTLGHRNPQGIAWTADGRMWASEFGQNTWDELNLIEPGGNYGWPVVEGPAGRDGYIDPVAQWPTDEASPSGLTVVNGSLFLAALRGERLLGILDGVTVPEGSRGLEGVVSTSPYFVGEFGRIRDAAPGPDGTLLIVTNNTDGRGSPREGDDRLIEISLAPMVEG